MWLTCDVGRIGLRITTNDRVAIECVVLTVPDTNQRLWIELNGQRASTQIGGVETLRLSLPDALPESEIGRRLTLTFGTDRLISVESLDENEGDAMVGGAVVAINLIMDESK